MDDMISRQAAIEAIEKARANVGHNMERAVGAAFIEILDEVGEDIGRLPSAQFATDTNVGTKLGTNLAEVGTDCISRQDALDICDHAIDLFKGQFGAGVLVAIKESIEELPSAQLDTYWKEQCQSYEQTINKLRESLSTQPEIIRCKGCKHRDNYGCCKHWKGLAMGDIPIATDDNDFCSNAERKTE